LDDDGAAAAANVDQNHEYNDDDCCMMVLMVQVYELSPTEDLPLWHNKDINSKQQLQEALAAITPAVQAMVVAAAAAAAAHIVLLHCCLHPQQQQQPSCQVTFGQAVHHPLPGQF
jgi:hypothetical protein